MWSKLYLVVLGLSLAAMAFLTYYSWSWLESIGQPLAVVDGYNYYSNLSWIALWLTAFILILLANAVLWTTQRAWAMWTTFLFVAAFLVAQYFWLGESFFRFKKMNGMFDGSFSLGPIFGVILIVISGIAIFINQFGSIRFHRKLYPAIATDLDSETEA